MKLISVTKGVAALAVALTFAGGTSGVVQAKTPPTPNASASAAKATDLSTVKSKCNDAVQKRLTTLTGDVGKINGAGDLSGSDKSSLLSIASSDSSGLTALDATIQADTTVLQARSDCKKIVDDYRVYVLFEPQMHFVIAADRITAAVTKISGLESQLQTAINGISDPTQKAAAQAALTDLESKLTATQAAISGITAQVLALTPSGYPGNIGTLQSAKSAAQSAKSDLQAGRADVTTIRDALKAGHTGKHSPAPSPSPSAT